MGPHCRDRAAATEAKTKRDSNICRQRITHTRRIESHTRTYAGKSCVKIEQNCRQEEGRVESGTHLAAS
eukprot:4464239-Pleurochrysis_carterae.AAC.1